MRPRSFLAFTGFLLIIIGTYCPLLRPLHLFNWNLYGLNQPYGVVVFVVAVVGIASAVLGQRAAVRAMAWVSLILVVLVYLAAVMKVSTSFSFIPFKAISDGLAKLTKFKWGWLLLFAGAIFAVLGSFGADTKVGYKPVKQQ